MLSIRNNQTMRLKKKIKRQNNYKRFVNIKSKIKLDRRKTTSSVHECVGKEWKKL